MATSITLLHCQAVDIVFHRYTSNEIAKNKNNQNGFAFDFAPLYDKKEKDCFSIIFAVNIEQVNQYRLSVKYVASFKASQAINNDFIKSGFTLINAPAIAFPYLRSFITTLVVSSGFKALILPSINFTKTKQAEELKRLEQNQ